MAIKQFEVTAMTEQEMDAAISSALASYGRSARDFEHASVQYNSEFFRGEPDEFRRRMCRALSEAFKPNINPFWQKNSEVV